MSHQAMMARALQLAERGLFTTTPNPRVGCVIAKHGEIIAEGWHQVAGGPHAEIHALNQLDEDGARGADCYVTLEPCSHTGKTPPCADALVKAGIKRAFIAIEDPNPQVAGNGIARLRQAGIEVEVGYLAEQAALLNRGFFSRMSDNKPYIRSKIAMSLDGRTAMASGESKWITGPEARQDVQKLRAQSCAIVTGIGTVLADDPELTVRPEDWYPLQSVRQPHRVVVDSQLQIPETARILAVPGATTVLTTVVQSGSALPIVTLAASDDQVDLVQLHTWLVQQQLNEVLIEAGSVLNGTLLQAGLIDEIIVYMAPKLMGDSAKGLFHLPALTQMADTIALTIEDVRAIGQDWRLTLKPHYQA